MEIGCESARGTRDPLMCQLPFESCPVMSIMKHAARANAQSLYPPKKRDAGSGRQAAEGRYRSRGIGLGTR